MDVDRFVGLESNIPRKHEFLPLSVPSPTLISAVFSLWGRVHLSTFKASLDGRNARACLDDRKERALMSVPPKEAFADACGIPRCKTEWFLFCVVSSKRLTDVAARGGAKVAPK